MRKPMVLIYPTEEHIGLATARSHLRVDPEGSPEAHPDDVLISSLITTAREWAEIFTGRTIARKTLEYVLDFFPVGAIELPGAPVLSLVSVTYLDADLIWQPVSDYQFDNYSSPPRLWSAASVSWPTTVAGQLNTVRVRYEAGYTLDGDSPDLAPLPKSIKQAMLLVLAHWYENREDSSMVKLDAIPLGAAALLRGYRIDMAMA